MVTLPETSEERSRRWIEGQLRHEYYLSVDIETDGPIPGDYSMLSLGAAAFRYTTDIDVMGTSSEWALIGTFTSNLETLPGAKVDHDTIVNFWRQFPDAWREATKNPKPPTLALFEFINWTKAYPGAALVCDPSGFDFTFLRWYLVHFGFMVPFSFDCIDMDSYAAGKLNRAFIETHKKVILERWPLPDHIEPHNHVALTDAIEQGEIFMRMRASDSRDAQLKTMMWMMIQASRQTCVCGTGLYCDRCSVFKGAQELLEKT